MVLDTLNKRLQLTGKAFDDNNGFLSITLKKIGNTSIQHGFITACLCPQGWEKKIDAGGHPYFHNTTTGQLTGVFPSETNLEVTGRTVTAPTNRDFDMNGLRLPQGWTMEYGEEGARPHYLNTSTKAAQWSTPLYQGEATSYTSSGIRDIKEVKPNRWDFQLFETDFERNPEFGRWEIANETQGLSLPAGWEQRQLSASGRGYFVNHNEKTTQWHHPLVKPPQDFSSYDDIEWDTDLGGLKLPNDWVRRCTKEGGKMYYVDKRNRRHFWP